ncbi:MAG: hypothetical protein NTY41_17345 [Proteobacteria bacterium]|nr:hypothetical protein [Pseudomonadota bacterium]
MTAQDSRCKDRIEHGATGHPPAEIIEIERQEIRKNLERQGDQRDAVGKGDGGAEGITEIIDQAQRPMPA